MALRDLLDEADLQQSELAQGISKSEAMVSRLVNGEARPSKETIDATLAFLTTRLGRPVTYEETFAEPEPAAPVVASETDAA